MVDNKTAHSRIANHINGNQFEIFDLEKKLRSLQKDSERAEELLRFTYCDRCDAELLGGFENAEANEQAAFYLNKTTMVCAFCDRKAVILFQVKEYNVSLMWDHSERRADQRAARILDLVG